MQGVVIDEESKYVKAAIVKVFKVQDLSDGSDTEAEAITYALTDENGRFVIRDLDPDEDYTIEIHMEDTTAIDVKDTAETVIEEIIENHVRYAAEMNVEDLTEIIDFEDDIEIDVEYTAEMIEEDAIDIDDEDTDFETMDAVEADHTDETVAFFQTDGAFVFIQNEELTGSYFTCGLKPETELQDKLYVTKNCTWN